MLYRSCIHLASSTVDDIQFEKYRFNIESKDSIPRIVRVKCFNNMLKINDKNFKNFVKVAAIQHAFKIFNISSILYQRRAIYKRISKLIKLAATMDVQILCLPEVWSKLSKSFLISFT